jgi:hypothetical protein
MVIVGSPPIGGHTMKVSELFDEPGRTLAYLPGEKFYALHGGEDHVEMGQALRIRDERSPAV